MDPRLSTAFDFADLRLHPDGTRVYQTLNNLRPGNIKVAVQNSRANWIARDAGGSGRIHKLKPRGNTKNQGPSQEFEEEDAETLVEVEEVEKEVEVDAEVDEQSDEEGKSLEETTKRKAKRVDKRKAKRQKFAIDYNYLLPKASDSNEVESPIANDGVNDDVMSLPEPSPDLLKCIHRFASEFYTERGQLLNISREYRKERKKRARKRQRALREEAGLSSPSGSSSSESDGDSENSGSDAGKEQEEEEVETEPDPDDHGEGPSNPQGVKGKTRRKVPQRSGKLYTDMYKMFDGSAIMVLGMLVQEHIAHLLTPQVPAGWEEEMINFFTHHQTSDEGSLPGLVATEDDGEINQEIDTDDAALSDPHQADDGEDDEEEETENEEPQCKGGNTKNDRGPDLTVLDNQISRNFLSKKAPAHVRAGKSGGENDNLLQTSSDESLPSELEVNSDSDDDADDAD